MAMSQSACRNFDSHRKIHYCLNFDCFIADAAEVLRSNRRLFEQNVQKAMRGGYVGSVYFERCLK